MFFMSEFLPRLPENVGKRSSILRSREPANEGGFDRTRIYQCITRCERDHKFHSETDPAPYEAAALVLCCRAAVLRSALHVAALLLTIRPGRTALALRVAFRASWKKKACPIVTPYPKGGALYSCQPCPGVPSMQSRMKQSNAAGRAVVISLEQLTIAEELSLRSDVTRLGPC